MEDLDQDSGFVLYRKRFPNGIKGTLELKEARDYTVVMINGRAVHRAFLGYGPDSSKLALDESGAVTLDLLVHNLGRISVITAPRSQDRARKGLVGGALLDGAELVDWEMYSMPCETIENFRSSSTPHTGPSFYRATFSIDKPAGTFLDLRNWSFGVVWVNGHNLGRFWDRGAVRSLFVPSHWLKAGENEIIVLELHDAPKLAELSGAVNLITETPQPFSVRLDRLPRPPSGIKTQK